MLVDECGLELHSSRSREQPIRGDMFASELQSRVVACILSVSMDQAFVHQMKQAVEDEAVCSVWIEVYV